MARATPPRSSRTSPPDSAPSGPVIDVEFRPVAPGEPPPSRPVPLSVVSAEPAPRSRRPRAAATASVKARCPVCGVVGVVGEVNVAGPVTLRMCGRCAAIGRGAAYFLGQLLR